MNSFLAIILDTWKQSQKQVIFMIMLVVLIIISLAAVIIPKQITLQDGTSRIGFIWEDNPSDFLETTWMDIYSNELMVDTPPTFEELQDEKVNKEWTEKSNRIQDQIESKIDYPKERRAIELIVYATALIISFASMFLFLAACSGYFPGMLSSGGIDIVLSKPLKRYQIYLAKFFGGMFLYSAAILVTYSIIFIGLGIRFGAWVGELYLVAPLQIFSAAVLYAMLATIGVFTRSSTLSLIIGLFSYLFIDKALSILIEFDNLNWFEKSPTISATIKLVRDFIPNFDLLRNSACSSVLSIPIMEWQPIITGGVWLILMLTFGILKFQRTDY